MTQPRSLHDGAGPPGAPVLSLPFSPGDIRILGQRKPGLRLAAVFLLAGERPASNGPVEAGEDGVHLSREQFQQLLAHRAAQPEPDAPQPVRRRRGPVPAAIARQRASFALHGRKIQAKRRRAG